MHADLLTPPTLLDRLIAQLSPRAGLRRHWDRQMLARAYEAASPRDKWKPRRPGASADADHQADAGLLRAKARSLVQNVPYIRAAMDSLVANVIGTGIVPVWQGPQAEKALALWNRWVPVADADGRRDLYGLQAMAYRAMEQDGEVLLRWRPRRAQDGLPVPLQVQLLEIDWLDTSRQRGAVGSNQIVNGVEHDLLGRVVAYWLWDHHPGDMGLRKRLRTESRRIPAEQITHLFRPERPGQGRGFTRLAPIISSARDLRLLQDAELQRKNLESRLAVLVSGDASLFSGPPQALTAEDAKKTGDLGALPSGGMVQVPPGSNISTVAPNANPGFGDYVKLELHLLLTGFGVPYEDGTGDMKGVNFSSARVRQSAYRRQCEQIQWLDVIPGMCMQMSRRFVAAADIVNELKDTPELAAPGWSTPKWDYVNPQQEVNAAVTEVGAGMQSLSEHIRRKGYDPKKVFAELKSDIEQLKEIGIFDALMFYLKGHSPSGEGGSKSKPDDEE